MKTNAIKKAIKRHNKLVQRHFLKTMNEDMLDFIVQPNRSDSAIMAELLDEQIHTESESVLNKRRQVEHDAFQVLFVPEETLEAYKD